jgi:hypothetical protein
MVLICIFLISNVIKYLFKCLLSIPVSSLMKRCLNLNSGLCRHSNHFSHTSGVLPIFWWAYLSFKSSSCVLDTGSLLDTWFANIFPVCDLPSHFLSEVSWSTKDLLLTKKLNLLVFSFYGLCFWYDIFMVLP